MRRWLRGRARRGEQGAVLTLVLVLVIVVSVSGVSIMALQTTTFEAQDAHIERRDVDAAAEDVITIGIQAGRDELGWGVVTQNEGPCTGSGFDDIDTFATDVTGVEQTLTLQCKPEPNSFAPIGDAADVPPHTLFITGGQTGLGNIAAITADDDIPFCYDWQATNTNPDCEAGIYVGPGVGDSNGGGVVVADTMAPGDEPLVVTNSSIVVRDPNSANEPRTFDAQGAIVARYKCDSNDGFGNPQVRAWYEKLADGSVTYETPECHDGGPTLPGPLVPYPQYPHRLMAWANDDNNNGNGEVSEVQIPDNASGLVSRNAPFCLAGSTKWVAFEPGYYDQADVGPINLVMNCDGLELVWFKPGKYYFDFDEGADAIKAPPSRSILVAGTPLGWTYPTTGTEDQPDKLMFAGNIGRTSVSNWDDPNIGAMERIDGYTSWTVLTNGNHDPRGADVKFDQFERPVPATGVGAATNVDKVLLEFAHKVDEADVNDFEPGYPRLVISVPNSGWGSAPCTVPLQKVTSIYVPGSDDDINQPDINLTNGCAAAGGTGWTGFTAGSWTADKVNAMSILYEARRQEAHAVAVTVDGARLRISYNGRPSPSYPEACNSQAAGVQFVLGGGARFVWNNRNDFHAVLCGSRADGDDYGLIFYGLPDYDPRAGATNLVPPPTRKDTMTYPLTESGSPPALSHQPNMGYNFFCNVGCAWLAGNTTLAALQGTGWVEDTTVGGSSLHDPDGAGPQPLRHALQRTDGYGWWAKLRGADVEARVRLPNVQDWVPDGSVIERVELHVAHRELTPAQLGYADATMTGPATGLYGDISLTVEPPANQGSSQWVSTSLPAAQQPKLTSNGELENWKVGLYDIDPEAADVQYNPNWKDQRLIAEEKLKTPGGLRDALLTWKVGRGDVNMNNRDKFVFLDSIELVVEYRVARSLRPLTGCTTTRLSHPPGPHNYMTFGEGLFHDDAFGAEGVMMDFGAGVAAGVPNSDAAYAATSAADDQGSCPLLVFDRGPKVHFRGSLYAPTAAIDLRGNDNEAPLVTGGIVVRQLTAYRWRKDGGIPTFGTGSHVERYPRSMTFRVVDESGTVLAERKVEYVDLVQNGLTHQPGTMKVLSSERRGGDA